MISLQAYFDHFLYMIREHGPARTMRCPIDDNRSSNLWDMLYAITEEYPKEEYERQFEIIADDLGLQYQKENCHPMEVLEDDLDMDNAYLFIGEFFDEQDNLPAPLREYFDSLCKLSEEYDERHHSIEPDPILDLILSIEKPESRPEDFDPQDCFGGNFDDAYQGGFRDGEEYGRWQLAQELLKLYGKSTE